MPRPSGFGMLDTALIQASEEGLVGVPHAPSLTAVSQKSRELRQEATDRVRDALSSAAIYTWLFATIAVLFGTRYMLIISPIVVIFRGKRKKTYQLSIAVKIVATLLILNVLAHIATLNLALSVLLNILVPFLLVIVQSSQFAPKAYFGYVMAYVFLELKPLSTDDFLTQLTVTAYAACVLAVVLIIMHWWKGRSARKRDPEVELNQSLDTLANLLDRLAEGESGERITQEFARLEHAFDLLCFNSRKLFRSPDRTQLRYYLYATLFQRAEYLLSDSAWQKGAESYDDLGALHDVAALVRQVRAAKTPQEYAVIRRCLQMLLDMVNMPEGRMRVFFRSLLHVLMLVCSDAPKRRRHLTWKMAPLREILEGFGRHLTPDSFEFRFAMRLSIVMVASFSLSILLGMDHAYWIPLNAFLLLMPSYEESAHRMRTRPIGTALGCILAFMASHALDSVLGIYAFCMLMIAMVYCCTPGSWVQASFATTFALTMASLTMDETQAMALRLLYVIIAVALVLVVNYLVLPSRRNLIYRANRRQLFRMCGVYWEFVRQSVVRHMPLHRSGELLSDFHLVYDEAYAYVKDMEDEAERTREHDRLVTLWHMFSEVEQVEYLVQSGELSDRDQDLLVQIARRLKERPAPAREGCVAVALIDQVISRDLRYALEHYVDNGFKLVGAA